MRTSRVFHTAGCLALVALVALLTACGSVRPPPSGSPTAPEPAPPLEEPHAVPDAARAVTMQAIGLVGTPYRYGGNTPEGGFDCSGLIAYVFWDAARQRTPRTTAELGQWGVAVPADRVQTGDVAVFSVRGRVSHAGIYVGNGRFVHAPSTGGTVRMDRLDTGYWARQAVQFRRGWSPP